MPNSAERKHLAREKVGKNLEKGLEFHSRKGSRPIRHLTGTQGAQIGEGKGRRREKKKQNRGVGNQIPANGKPGVQC